MPHLIIECSENILKLKTPYDIMQTVHETTEGSGQFDKGDIKVRLNPYLYFNNGNTKDDFIHIFGNIMEDGTTEQKADPSKKIITTLKSMFNEVPIVSMNIRDFERVTYCNISNI